MGGKGSSCSPAQSPAGRSGMRDEMSAEDVKAFRGGETPLEYAIRAMCRVVSSVGEMASVAYIP